MPIFLPALFSFVVGYLKPLFLFATRHIISSPGFLPVGCLQIILDNKNLYSDMQGFS
jgi:hypothetical protein